MNWMNLDPQIVSIIAVAAALFAICVEARRRIARSQRRAHELRLCAEMLDQHRASLEEFLDSPDAPQKLKTALIRFSEVTSDREKAHQVVSAMCAGQRMSRIEAETAKAMRRDVDSLRLTHPDLAHAFETAISSSMGAMLFRWAETADMFRDFLTKAVVDSRKGSALFARAARYGADRAAGEPLSVAPGHAVAM